MTDPSTILRGLRTPLARLGVELGDVTDDATLDDLEEVLLRALDAVDRLRPVRQAPAEAELTGRARAVERLAAQGLTDAEIGARVGASAEAVRSIRRRAAVPSARPAGGAALRTGWEARVLEVLAAGGDRRAVAEALGWTLGTASTRISQLRRRGLTP